MAPITQTDARGLLRDYVNTLDRGRLADWPNFFVEACSYRITTRESEERGFSIMLCNNRAMLFERIEATEKANIFEPHSYRHILSDSEVVSESDNALTMRTSFLCIRVMHTGETTLFVCGEYIDEIVRAQGRCLFRSKRVVVDSPKTDTLIAIPI